MKKRIVALVLTVVMSLLALVGCFSSFDAARVDYVKDGYAEFDAAKFLEAIKNIEIEDEDFTTNEETRDEKTMAAIYKAVTDAIVKSPRDDEKLKEGTLDANDVLYFVYYAEVIDTNEKHKDLVGKTFFGSDMNVAALTSTTSSIKDRHNIQLGGDYTILKTDTTASTKDTKAFLKALQESLKFADGDIDIKDYIYDIDTTEIAKDSYKPKAGDILYITYKRSYVKTTPATAEGEAEKKETITETATYEKIVIDETNPFHAKLMEGKAVYGATDGFKITEGEGDDAIEYTYTGVKVLWDVTKEGKELTSFDFKFTGDTNEYQNDLAKYVKTNLKDVQLKIHVFPVYYLESYSTPAKAELGNKEVNHDIVKAILTKVKGLSLTSASFKALSEEGYKIGDKKLGDVMKSIEGLLTPVVNTTDESKTGEFYKKDSDLRKLYDTHAKAVTDGGSNPTGDKKTAIDNAKKALNEAQAKKLEELVAEVLKAKNGDKDIAVEIYKQYYEDTYYGLATSYNTKIQQKVQDAVWELIQSSVTVKNYPEKLVKEFTTHVYETFEYNYYTGSQTSGQKLAFVDVYEDVEAFIRSTDGKTYLKTTISADMSFEKILDAEAKYYLKDIIKIFVVAQALEADAKAALPGFINKDIEKTVIFGPVYGSLYYPHEDHIEDEDDRKAFDDSVEQYNDYKEFVLDTADNFIIDNDYLKAFKKFVGSSSYKSFMESTGEVNVRAGYQLYNILYYLTSTDLLPLDEDRHEESCQPAYTEADAEGNIYLAFRVVEYTIKAADDTTTESDDTTSDSKND